MTAIQARVQKMLLSSSEFGAAFSEALLDLEIFQKMTSCYTKIQECKINKKDFFFFFGYILLLILKTKGDLRFI